MKFKPLGPSLRNLSLILNSASFSERHTSLIWLQE